MRSEYNLIESVKPHLYTIFNNSEIYEEVSCYNRTIDMIAYSNDLLSVIEFKLNDWKKAVKQIKESTFIADYNYICMPKKIFSTTFYDLLKSNGIGLLLYDVEDNKLIEKIPPQKNSFKNDYFKNRTMNNARGR